MQRNNKLLTPDQHDFLMDNYLGIGNAELTNLINARFATNLTASQIKSYKRNRRLDSGLNGRFIKGMVPVNKGTKGMFNVGGNKTSFKKGQAARNWCPMGTELLKADGYVYIKVSDIRGVHSKTNWKQKHRIIYEKYYGITLNPKDKVVFLDGDHFNFEIDNLEILTESENLIRNLRGLNFKDKELSRTGVTLAKVIAKTQRIK